MYDIHGGVTVLQAIALSGGVKETSKESQVVLVRKVNAEIAEVKGAQHQEHEEQRKRRQGGFRYSARRHADRSQEPSGENRALRSVTSMAFTGLYGIAIAK